MFAVVAPQRRRALRLTSTPAARSEPSQQQTNPFSVRSSTARLTPVLCTLSAVALCKPDMKDDSCGSCRDVVDDYSTMQQAIWSVGRPITLTIEGGPDIKSVYTGYCGNARRVGHDISPRWNSMTSLIDVGSGLWPYAHNGSKSANASNPGGFWNDLDMIEVGNGAFVAETSALGAAQARSHFTMWAAMKAVMLLGCDLTRVGPDTLDILKQPNVVAVNQDSLGVQARRVASTRPKNTSLVEGDHAVALLAPCDPSDPLQRWPYRAPTRSSGAIPGTRARLCRRSATPGAPKATSA